MIFCEKTLLCIDFGRVRTNKLFNIGGSTKKGPICGATIAQWIILHLPYCGPGFNTGLFFFIFVFSIQLLENKICRCLDSNYRSLVLEVTTLPTEPQPLPYPFVVTS